MKSIPIVTASWGGIGYQPELDLGFQVDPPVMKVGIVAEGHALRQLICTLNLGG